MIDFSKLENVVVDGSGWQSMCPACALSGSDQKGKNHLRIFKSGAFNCVVNPGDKEHNRKIYSIIGKKGEIDYDDTEDIPYQIKPDLITIYDSSLLEKLVKDYTYWNDRKIPSEIVSPLEGGIAVDGKMKYRWVFPIFNENRQIIGFIGRKLKDSLDIKWKKLGDFSEWIYGDLDYIKKEKKAILIESIGDYLALKKYNINGGLVLFGVSLNQATFRFLISHNVKNINLSLNNDPNDAEVGQRAANKLGLRLSKFFDTENIHVALPISKDFGNSTDEQINEWKEKYYNGN